MELLGCLDVALLAFAAEGGEGVMAVLCFLITGVVSIGTLILRWTLAKGPHWVCA